MKEFFRNPSKVALTSLIATVVVSILLVFLITLTDIHISGKVIMAVALSFLIVNPVLGFIYSFFIKGKRKIIYILLHFISLCTISVFAFIAFMFTYFLPFGP
ncbi:hypothetical protein HPT25_05875 [Bacillus sp. BRMEA1]|uniref:hypothetical protein n=1 Tax=Neobacillus endophyticus TaxID=2738405 RepID=UPI0015652710|nr:hypothetical protein [Neobacillus endophyticus]NRD77023.1 hypothetical protein [Neobacillus endophyticus]